MCQKNLKQISLWPGADSKKRGLKNIVGEYVGRYLPKGDRQSNYLA
ncbi:unnamed protein product, partial [Musa hybrid cultivar]